MRPANSAISANVRCRRPHKHATGFWVILLSPNRDARKFLCMKSKTKPASGALSRRHFIKATSLAAGAVTFGVPTLLRAANLNSKLNIAAIGAMGKGESDTDHCSSENIVALCDVDADRCAKQREKYPGAKFYQDYRKLFDEMSGGIDAVTVSTPDHMHAIIATLAMKQGKHVYCQKPLVQTIYEARYLRRLAQTSGLVTQMGNQGSSADGLRRAVEVIQAGIIGQVHEVHIWTNRPVWPQGMDRPAGCGPRSKFTGLGHLDWRGSDAALQTRSLSSVELARLAGFRHRRAGRHGVSHGQHAVPRLVPRLPDGD